MFASIGIIRPQELQGFVFDSGDPTVGPMLTRMSFPHWLQKTEPSGLLNPQFGHFIILVTSAVGVTFGNSFPQ
jgi:hypothetical protein